MTIPGGGNPNSQKITIGARSANVAIQPITGCA
jgi:hypothetical protein